MIIIIIIVMMRLKMIIVMLEAEIINISKCLAKFYAA